MKLSSPGQRQWITKRAAHDCGNNSVLFKRKFKDSDGCPLCGQSETTIHVLCCQDTRAQQQWESSMTEFRSWLAKYKTDPVISEQLCNGLQQWRQSGQVIQRTINESLIRHQNLIGWNAVLEGCLGEEWAKQQQKYFEINNSRRTGFKWQVAVCKRIWQIPWDMWNHRNSIEHANDVKVEMEKLDKAIDEEVHTGSGNCIELEQMLNDFRLQAQRSKSAAYKKRWLRGVEALRGRVARRGLSDRIMNGMRATMRQFLHRE